MSTQRNNKLRFSLKFKVLFGAIVSSLAITLSSWFLISSFAERIKGDMVGRYEDYALGLSDLIQSAFFERYGDVQAFAQNHAFFEPSVSDKISVLNKYVSLYPIYDLIIVTDAKGNLVATNTLDVDGKPIPHEKIKGINFSDSLWFRSAMEKKYSEQPEIGLTGSYYEDVQIDPIVSQVYGRQTMTTVFSTQIIGEKGELLGVLSTRANFRWVEHIFEDMYHQLRGAGFKSSELTLINKKGVVLIDYDPVVQGSDEIDHDNHDFNTILKLNLADKGLAIAKDLVNNNSGGGIYEHARKKISQIAGYRVIGGEKMLSSIGWGAIIRESSEEMFASVNGQLNLYYFIQIPLYLLIIALSWLLSNSISKKFIEVSEKLKLTAEDTLSNAHELQAASREVSEASVEQAAAVQETVSSMTEISSMIGQTVQHVKESSGLTQKVEEQSMDGSRIMQRLVNSMDSIHAANQQLQNMANIINEVNNKAMIINDIVFKTQLLSINASIEAARAGHHGKGFSVVAEEVGNLAQTSGEAAKEIQELIQSSQKQVKDIIEVTQQRVNDGQAVTNEAQSVFTEITRGVSMINQKSQSIEQATREQEIGIQQVSEAMTQMDQATMKNSSSANQAASLANSLQSQSEKVTRIMNALRTLVLGSAARKSALNKGDVISEILGEQTEKDTSESGGKKESPYYPSNGGGSDNLSNLAEQVKQKKMNLSQAKEHDNISADDDSFKKVA